MAATVRSCCLLMVRFSCCLLLVACKPAVPVCPYVGEPDYAPSAGCLAVLERRVLLVEMRSGRLSPPGGKAGTGESAQCAAHRETWEETGLDLMPGQLIQVFETGFHLYRCDFYRNYDSLNAWPSEVEQALWLPVGEMESKRWRFPGQGRLLRELIEQ
jgi:8-oxo-dGTP pyrophosphatase MutT (NUDIX family)